jgi:hypothetical protein
LDEITSGNPFLRLSRSKIKELNIPTLIHSDSKLNEKEKENSKPKKMRKLSSENKNRIEIIEESNLKIQTPMKTETQMKKKSVNKFSSPLRKYVKNTEPIENSMTKEEYINLLIKKVQELLDSVAQHKKIHTRVALNALSAIVNKYIDFSFNEPENMKLKEILQRAFDCLKKLNIFEVKISFQ